MRISITITTTITTTGETTPQREQQQLKIKQKEHVTIADNIDVLINMNIDKLRYCGNVDKTITLLDSLGFIINSDESGFEPKKVLELDSS